MLAGDARLGAEAHRAFLEDAETDRLKRMVEDLVATAETGRGAGCKRPRQGQHVHGAGAGAISRADLIPKNRPWGKQ